MNADSTQTTELIRAAILVEQAVKILHAANASDLPADLQQVRSDIEVAINNAQ